jgi:hypothetical protein
MMKRMRANMWLPRTAWQFLAILQRARGEDQWAIEILPPDEAEGGTRWRVTFRLASDARCGRGFAR